MRSILITFMMLIISTSVFAQSVAPYPFGDEYRILKDMDVVGNVVAVVSVNDAINSQEKPFHLAFYGNEQWMMIPSIYMNNGILDTIHANHSLKVRIAPNKDIWVAAKNLCKFSNGK